MYDRRYAMYDESVGLHPFMRFVQISSSRKNKLFFIRRKYLVFDDFPEKINMEETYREI